VHAINMRVGACNYHRQSFVRDRSKSGGRQRHAHRCWSHAPDRMHLPLNGHLGAKTPAAARHCRHAADGFDHHISRRLSRTARHVGRQSRTEAHRRGAWIERRPAAMGPRRLQSRLRGVLADRWNARRYLRAPPLVHGRRRSLHRGIADLRDRSRQCDLDRRQGADRARRRVRDANVARNLVRRLS
jgi:hypothetical protein